jgi:hypothetical protein
MNWIYKEIKQINKKDKMESILIITKWVLLLICSVVGMVILATDPSNQSLGLILTFGCFIVFALDVARTFSN